MSGAQSLDASMNSTWFGLSTPMPSAKVVEGKTPAETKPVEVEAVSPEDAVNEAPQPPVAEEISTDVIKDELEAEPTHGSGGGLMAKLGIPVAAAVAVWAVIAKVAA